MNTIQVTTLNRDEVLVAELHRLGVRHLARLASIETAQLPTPEELIIGLAGSQDARLQAALILLFLRQPTYSQYISNTFDQLSIPTASA